MIKTYCDWCGNLINNEFVEAVPVWIIKFPFQDTIIFDCEECRDEFINEHCKEVYLYRNGHLDD